VSDFAQALEIRQVVYSHPDSVALTAAVQAHYRQIYGGPDSAPMRDDEFAEPTGAFFVAYLTGRAVAMGGWRFHAARLDLPAERPAEIKRMYVVEAARRHGVARRLLAHLEDSAWRAGADAIVLETGLAQPAAIALYRAEGYVDVPRFGHYAHEPDAVHLGKLRVSALSEQGIL
jgi:GNAT superfamily N-acetyltransferase